MLWVLLSKDRITALSQTIGTPAVAPVQKIETTPAQADAAVAAAGASTFVGWILAGEKDKAFALLRSLAANGASTDTLMGESAALLDELYRAVCDNAAHPETDLCEKVKALPKEKVEGIIGALTSAIDQPYSSAHVGAKLAVTKALGVIA